MQVFTFRRFAFVLASVVLLTLLGSIDVAGAERAQAAPSANQMASGTAGDQFVGADTCKACHEDIVNGMATTPHWSSTLKVNGVEVHACETCHGPGAAHVAGGGDVSKIFVFEGKSTSVISERCLTCHQATQSHGNFTRSQHFNNGISCISCHSPHHAREKNALLIEDQPSLCYRCHTDIKADFAKPFRHRVNSQLLQCTDCHNVHGGTPRRSLRTAADDQMVCFKCHRDKEGPFLYEHVPVKTEGCTACHTPHGSTNPRLLRVYPVNVLCLECHTFTTNSGIPGTPSFHNQAQKYQACTMCHPMIHGSNGVETFEY